MRCAVALQVPLVERSHLYAPVRHGCDDGTDVGDVVSAFVGAGEGDAIGVFVSAVVVAMRATPLHVWQSSTPSSSTARKPDWRRCATKHGLSNRELCATHSSHSPERD